MTVKFYFKRLRRPDGGGDSGKHLNAMNGLRGGRRGFGTTQTDNYATGTSRSEHSWPSSELILANYFVIASRSLILDRNNAGSRSRKRPGRFEPSCAPRQKHHAGNLNQVPAPSARIRFAQTAAARSRFANNLKSHRNSLWDFLHLCPRRSQAGKASCSNCGS